MSNKIAIVLPAYNEEDSLPGVLENLPNLGPEFEVKVFVVDDGSSDNTLGKAQKYGARVARHPIRLGVGGALKTGYDLALEWGADYIVQLDADGEHDPKDVLRLLQPVLDGKADMIVGSRFLNKDLKLSLTRKIGIRFYTWLINKLTGYKLTDVTSGYRAFRTAVNDKIMFPSDKHWAIEMTLLAGKNGLSVGETQITNRLRKTGKSQFHDLTVFLLYQIHALKQLIDVYL